MKQQRLIMAVGAALVLAIAGLVVLTGDGKARSDGDQAEVARGDPATAKTADRIASAKAVLPPGADAGHSVAAGAEHKSYARKFASKEAREKFVRALAAARTRRIETQKKRLEEPPEALDAVSIRKSVRNVLPLLKECYELALETTPDLAGVVTLEFVIAGEPEVGGLVEEVTFAEENDFSRHAVFSECFLETVMSLELPAPDAGGKVKAVFPIMLHPDE